jgi:hypothetical protein
MELPISKLDFPIHNSSNCSFILQPSSFGVPACRKCPGYVNKFFQGTKLNGANNRVGCNQIGSSFWTHDILLYQPIFWIKLLSWSSNRFKLKSETLGVNNVMVKTNVGWVQVVCLYPSGRPSSWITSLKSAETGMHACIMSCWSQNPTMQLACCWTQNLNLVCGPYAHGFCSFSRQEFSTSSGIIMVAAPSNQRY